MGIECCDLGTATGLDKSSWMNGESMEQDAKILDWFDLGLTNRN
ncbi:hypothetical protein Hanom_Chr17g01550061 [Helianthus anomalus]